MPTHTYHRRQQAVSRSTPDLARSPWLQVVVVAWALAVLLASAGAADKPEVKARPGLVLALDRVFDLTPPPIERKAEVILPAAADAARVGGGGRFLIYRIPSAKQLAILDVTVGKVVKQIALTEPSAPFAAGMTKLFVYSERAKKLLRYSLETFEQEAAADNPLGGTPIELMMGHSSDGPLYVGGADVGTTATKGYGFVHPDTLAELSIPLRSPEKGPAPLGPVVRKQVGSTSGSGLEMSPDGRTLYWPGEFGSHRVMTLGETGGTVSSPAPQVRRLLGRLVPGPDGTLFSPAGLFHTDLKQVGDAAKFPEGAYIPATSGPWYVQVIEGEKTTPGVTGGPPKLSLAVSGDDSLSFNLGVIDGLPSAVPTFGGPPPVVALHDRVRFIPEAEVLAVLDNRLQTVHLYRVRAKTLLEKSDRAYLLTFGRPPTAARGKAWAYTPNVWASKGEVKVQLGSGPDGMKIDGTTVRWDVPAKFVPDEVEVVLRVSGADGREVSHAFTLSVRTDAPVRVVIKPPAPKADSRLAVKPAPVFTVTPTQAKDGTDVELSGAADFACLAGGGRFLLLRIPAKKEVAVFDVVAAKVVKQLPLDDPEGPIAGSQTAVYAADVKGGVLRRWSLDTFEKGPPLPLPRNFKPQLAVMGHASEGPLFLGGTDEKGVVNLVTGPSGFYDPRTMTKKEFYRDPKTDVHAEITPKLPVNLADSVHASPDGRVFGWWKHNLSPSGFYAVALSDGVAHGTWHSMGHGSLRMGSDGNLYTGAGVFAPDLKAVLASNVPLPNRSGAPDLQTAGAYGRPPVPAADGPFYLWFGPGLTNDPPALMMIGAKDPLEQVKGIRGLSAAPDRPAPNRGRGGGASAGPVLYETGFGFHRRAFLIATADLLVVVSEDGKSLYLHSVKVRDLLDKSGQEYLLVMNHPPQLASRGTTWTFTPSVWSKKGGVKVELVTGPSGMKVAGGGLTWAVPATSLDEAVSVGLKVSDASGRTVTSSFTLSLTDGR